MKRVALMGILILVSAMTVQSDLERFESAEEFLKKRDFDQAAEQFLIFADEQSDHEDAPLALYTVARIRLLAQQRIDGLARIGNPGVDDK